jgi:hypothetical protein
MSTLTQWMPTLTKLDVNIDINDGRVNVSTQPPPPPDSLNEKTLC